MKLRSTAQPTPHASGCLWRRAGISVVVLFALVGARASFAQQPAPAEHKAEPAPQQAEGQKPGPQKHEEGRPAEAGEHRQSLGNELAEASKEAAGEEGDQFKQSASVRWFARKTGLGPKTTYWIFVVLNFAILAGLAVFFLKSKLPAAMRARTAAIRQQIEEARAASAEARSRLAGIEERLAKIDSEISSMRSAAEAEAKKQEEQSAAAAEEDKKRIVAAARQEIAGATRAARQELKSYAAQLAVDLAARSINVDAHTDRALVHNFAERFGKDGQ
ncbi:MAG TPA: ATP synthase F0 subunit B [Terriglobales bacterium]|nr:ATP synthase F0 subunit B [Terriglobales bacterium]